MPDVTPDQIADVAGRLRYTDGEDSLHNKIAERLRKWRDQSKDFLRSQRYDQWAEVEKHRTSYIDLRKLATKGDGSRFSDVRENPVDRALVIPLMQATLDVRRVQMKAVAHARNPQFQFFPVPEVSSEPTRIAGQLMDIVLDQSMRRGRWLLYEDTFLGDADALNCGVLYNDWYVREGWLLKSPKIKPAVLEQMMQEQPVMALLMQMQHPEALPGERGVGRPRGATTDRQRRPSPLVARSPGRAIRVGTWALLWSPGHDRVAPDARDVR